MTSVEMGVNLLVYGSLMSDRVRTHVMKYSHADYVDGAVITGEGNYHRFAIQNRSYPALCRCTAVAQATEPVDGVLLRNVGPEAMLLLDQFEGQEYVRCAIQVKLPEGGTVVDAFVYEWVAGEKDAQLYGTWSFEKDFLPQQEATLKLWGFEE